MTAPADVTFTADGFDLAGHLHRPARAACPSPAVVLTGPLTGVKEQVTGTYAAGLAARGFIALAFDHRRFGASSGTPRQHEDAAGKVRDLLAATTFLAGLDDVDADRVAGVGICLGTSYALRHAAIDPRIRALGLVAGAHNDPAAMRAGIGPEGYRAILAEAARLDEAAAAGEPTAYMPAVAEGGAEAAMGGDEPFAYYGTDRAASPGWVNRVTRTSIRELITLDAVSAADLLTDTPTVVVHGTTDDYCAPEQARALHERLPGATAIHWLETPDHIALYDDPHLTATAMDHVAAWLGAHLGD